MFKGIFGKGKKDEKKNAAARKKKENRKSRKVRKEKRKTQKLPQPKADGTDPSTVKVTKNVSVEDKSSVRKEGKSAPLELRHRRKKGKRPAFKKVTRPVAERKKGAVTRSGNKYYPGDSDFKYTSPKEIWVPCLGQKISSVDLGDEARLLPDPSIAVTQKVLQI